MNSIKIKLHIEHIHYHSKAINIAIYYLSCTPKHIFFKCIFYICLIKNERHVCTAGSVAVSQFHGPRFNPELQSVRNFTCSSYICMHFVQILQFHSTSQRHASTWMGYVKMSLDVCAWCPVREYSPIQGMSLPRVQWNRLWIHHYTDQDNAVIEWKQTSK